MGSRRIGWAVLLCVVGVVASCSSAPEVNTDPIVVTTVPTTTAAPTTVAPITTTPATSAAPTTTVAPTTTTTVDQVEADILAAVDGFLGVVLADLDTGVPPDPDDPRFGAWAVDPQLSRSVASAAGYRDLGRTWFGSVTYAVIDVTVDGDIATATVCVDDQATGFESDGETVFDGPDDQIHRDALSLVESDGGWKVSDWVRTGSSCDSL